MAVRTMVSWRRRHSSFSLGVGQQPKALHGALYIRVDCPGSINWTLCALTREQCRLREDAVDSPILGEKSFGSSSSVDAIKMAIVSEERCMCILEGIVIVADKPNITVLSSPDSPCHICPKSTLSRMVPG